MNKKDKKQKSLVNESVEIEKLASKLPPKRRRAHHVVIQIDKLSKSFRIGGKPQEILKNINVSLYSGEFVVIYGPSGCGKSTLLHTILGLERPTKGKVWLREKDLYKLSDDERTNYRRQKIGMVFQQSNWIKSLTVLENVSYPLLLSGYDEKMAKERSMQALEEVGMSIMAGKKPTELSGGQQQRVALARALTTDPWIIMADEPTGNLDSTSSAEMIELLARLNREGRRTVVMVTHDMNFLPIATRRIGILDGRVVVDEHD